MKKKKNIIYIILLLGTIGVGICQDYIKKEEQERIISENSYILENIPEYKEEEYVILNENNPNFTENDFTLQTFENYSELDSLGRAGTAFANIGKELMPTKERESLVSIKPAGWHTIKYEHIDGKYLYNRCHLIGYQLTGENANEKNLITCTRQMNTVGMLPFENKIAEYIKTTDNHVLYRVTPIYKEDNLLASGVELEAESVEDRGTSLKFHVYVYNSQKGIEINYKNGESKLIE